MQFRFKGNKSQFTFNEEIAEALEKASNRLSEGKPVIAKEVVDLKKSNKLIRLADKSDAGWAAVDEYLLDELASDIEDEKRIRSAQTRAAAKKKKNKSLRPRPYNYRRQNAAETPPNPDSRNNYSFRRYNQQYRYQYSFGRGGSGPRPSDECFGCHQKGHWRRNCQNDANKQTTAQIKIWRPALVTKVNIMLFNIRLLLALHIDKYGRF